VGVEHEVPERGSRHAVLAKPLNGEDVAHPLGHLRAVHEEEGAVAPHARERLPRSRLALSDLVLVVREDEVDSAAMEVQGLAEQIHGHRRALEVPAWTPAPPG
jgi:hypothetical protein